MYHSSSLHYWLLNTTNYMSFIPLIWKALILCKQGGWLLGQTASAYQIRNALPFCLNFLHKSGYYFQYMFTYFAAVLPRLEPPVPRPLLEGRGGTAGGSWVPPACSRGVEVWEGRAEGEGEGEGEGGEAGGSSGPRWEHWSGLSPNRYMFTIQLVLLSCSAMREKVYVGTKWRKHMKTCMF